MSRSDRVRRAAVGFARFDRSKRRGRRLRNSILRRKVRRIYFRELELSEKSSLDRFRTGLLRRHHFRERAEFRPATRDDRLDEQLAVRSGRADRSDVARPNGHSASIGAEMERRATSLLAAPKTRSRTFFSRKTSFFVEKSSGKRSIDELFPLDGISTSDEQNELSLGSAFQRENERIDAFELHRRDESSRVRSIAFGSRRFSSVVPHELSRRSRRTAAPTGRSRRSFVGGDFRQPRSVRVHRSDLPSTRKRSNETDFRRRRTNRIEFSRSFAFLKVKTKFYFRFGGEKKNKRNRGRCSSRAPNVFVDLQRTIRKRRTS